MWGLPVLSIVNVEFITYKLRIHLLRYGVYYSQALQLAAKVKELV